MRINNITISNFGPISSFEANPTGNLIGVVGKNGQGKSHILTALRFLFTNSLEHNNSTYIKQGAKNAEISVKFSAGSSEGTIIKRLTKTSTRNSFLWEGKEYTKAEPIVRVIEDIFATDKNSMNEVAFRRQGDLTQLLFGYASVREQLFASLLKADFTTARDIIRTKTNVLRGRVTDYTAFIMEEEDVLTKARLELSEVEEELNRIPADALEKYRSLQDQLKADEKFRLIRASLNTLAEQLDSEKTVLTHFEKFSDFNSYAERLREAELKYREISSRLTDISRKADRQRQYNEDAGVYEVTHNELAIATSDLRLTANPDLESLRSVVQGITVKLNGKKEYDLATSDLESVTRILHINEKKRSITDTLVKKETTKVSELTQQVSSVSRILKAREAVLANKNSSDETTCGVCNLRLDTSALAHLSMAAVSQMREDLDSARTQLVESESQLKKSTDLLQEARDEFNRVSAKKSRLEDVIDRNRIHAEVNVEELTQNLMEAEKNIRVAKDIQEKRQNLQVTIRSLDNIVKTRRKAMDEYLSTIGATGEDFVSGECKVKDELKAHNELLAELERKVSGMRSGYESWNNQRSKISAITDQLEEAKRKFADYEKSGVTGLKPHEISAIEKEIELYSATSRKYESLLAVRSERTRAVENSKAKIEELKAKEREDGALRSLINKMEESRNLLSKSGIPGIFMTERFLEIVELTQHYLGMMNASFQVFPADEGIAFQFYDADKGIEEGIAQEKLSGGQKVRLSIAFMLAAGQLLIPNVRFLTLDEPSTHLDDEGVDSLISLFTDLSAQIVRDDWQVWVVDHNQQFMRAFSDVYTL